MAVETRTRLGKVAYPTLKLTYGTFGFLMGAGIGAAIGAGLTFVATAAGEGITHALGTPIPPGEDFRSVFFTLGIPVSGIFGLVGGYANTGLALDEFNRDFVRKYPKRTRRS